MPLKLGWKGLKQGLDFWDGVAVEITPRVLMVNLFFIIQSFLVLKSSEPSNWSSVLALGKAMEHNHEKLQWHGCSNITGRTVSYMFSG